MDGRSASFPIPAARTESGVLVTARAGYAGDVSCPHCADRLERGDGAFLHSFAPPSGMSICAMTRRHVQIQYELAARLQVGECIRFACRPSCCGKRIIFAVSGTPTVEDTGLISPFRIDVSCRMRDGSRVAIEVFHSSRATPRKCFEFERAGIPLIEARTEAFWGDVIETEMVVGLQCTTCAVRAVDAAGAAKLSDRGLIEPAVVPPPRPAVIPVQEADKITEAFSRAFERAYPGRAFTEAEDLGEHRVFSVEGESFCPYKKAAHPHVLVVLNGRYGAG